MDQKIKDQIDQILIDLSKDIEIALCVGPMTDCKDRLDKAISKARLRIQEIDL